MVFAIPVVPRLAAFVTVFTALLAAFVTAVAAELAAFPRPVVISATDGTFGNVGTGTPEPKYDNR